MGAILPCCLPYGKAGGLQILCCQGIKVTDYILTLDALALKPSDFCSVRVMPTNQQGQSMAMSLLIAGLRLIHFVGFKKKFEI
jgi:hypothetical protein